MELSYTALKTFQQCHFRSQQEKTLAGADRWPDTAVGV
jgi:hypothetical protein